MKYVVCNPFGHALCIVNTPAEAEEIILSFTQESDYYAFLEALDWEEESAENYFASRRDDMILHNEECDWSRHSTFEGFLLYLAYSGMYYYKLPYLSK